ncbi:MAG: hypothetical protein ACRDBH_04660 [Bosea sp. (in: a-proteobacteria)]
MHTPSYCGDTQERSMGRMEIRDHAVWMKHIEGDPAIVERLLQLPQNAPIALQVDGKPVLFRKMRDGSDGRPTQGIRPDESFKDYWNTLFQQRRGEIVQLTLNETPTADPYLASISALLSDWDSPEDNEAYNDL